MWGWVLAGFGTGMLLGMKLGCGFFSVCFALAMIGAGIFLVCKK